MGSSLPERLCNPSDEHGLLRQTLRQDRLRFREFICLDRQLVLLEQQPLENDAPWLCFYHQEKGYAFGSIRLDYDNHDDFGEPSPLYHPHTRISDGAGGGKYWNRRLIDEQRTYVPRGSRYIEENAYLVFRIDVADKFREIREWAARLRQPPRVTVQ